MNQTIREIHQQLINKEITITQLIQVTIERIKESDINAFITLNEEESISLAMELDQKEITNPLFGMPIAIKDNLCTKGIKTTCASKMLEDFIPVYDATVIERLKDKGVIIIGKLNMDEFAMGSNNQTSYFGEVKNPWNINKVPGGSSGGTTAAIADRLIPIALGSDTGGSIRQPAAFCGVVGMKPTYGRVSRYGMIAFASTLDQIGPVTNNVYDNALLLQAISGYDERDATSSIKPVIDYTQKMNEPVNKLRVAYPKTYLLDKIDSQILKNIDEVIELLKQNGVTVDDVPVPYLEYAIPLYQIIAHAEASSNLARFDGIRYGYRHPSDTIEDMYKKTRSIGFGKEVKRRIMIGTNVLVGNHYNKYYYKALRVRRVLSDSFQSVLSNYHLIIMPTTTTVAYDNKRHGTNTVKNYFDDLLTIPVNMAGLPALSLPIGFNDEHLPIGLQIIGNYFEEEVIYQLASFIENELSLDLVPKRRVSNE